MIRQLHWKLAHQLRAWGAGRVLGFALIVAAALTYGFTLQRFEGPLAETARQLKTGAAPTSTSDLQLAGNLNFPPAQGALASLGQLQQLALENGLVFDSGQFKQEEAGKNLVRYRINLPVVGSYIDLRAFLSQAMERFPNLALEGLRISREEPAMEGVDAALQLSFYFLP